MPTVRIIVPPVLSVARPSLGVGLLKSALLAQGVDCDSVYSNIGFAARIGCELNELLAEKIDTRPLLAEWLFSSVLYPDRSEYSDQRYLAYAKHYIDPKIIARVVETQEDLPEILDELVADILAEEPAIVGISTSFQQNTATLALAAALKRKRPNLVICLGGANCEGPMGQAIARNFPFVDHVFSGESDISFPRFVTALLDGPDTGKSMPRVISGAPVTNLDVLPTPDYDDYFHELRNTGLACSVRPSLIFESSRGCWWGAKHHCKFCGLNGTSMTYRAKSPERVISELDELNRRWGATAFMAADNILDHKSIDALFAPDRVDDAPYSLFYEVKANLNHEQLKRLAAGGVRWIQPGIESLHDEILTIMDKGISALLNLRLLRNCSELGIVPVWNLLWGFPGENEKHYGAMARLAPLIEHLSPPRGPFRIRLDRFSPYFEDAQAYGFGRPGPMPGYSAIYQLPEAELRDLAYFFDDDSSDEKAPDGLTDWCQAVAKWRSRHFTTDERPVLSLVDVGGIAFLRDTRAISRQEYRLLDEASLALLRHFRDPRSIDEAPREVSRNTDLRESELSCALSSLIEDGLIVADGRKALSLPLDFAFSRSKGSDALAHPFGEWLEDVRGRSPADAARKFNRGNL